MGIPAKILIMILRYEDDRPHTSFFLLVARPLLVLNFYMMRDFNIFNDDLLTTYFDKALHELTTL